MQVSTSNDVRIYNLSAGKSIPQWLNERKRRTLERKDIDIRRRIQLIQDFEMPCVSSAVAVTPDQQYVYAAGSYKPTLRCYDVVEMSPKFERGLDADVIKILPLTEDYSKVVLLEEERHIEFHARYGRYHQMRMPKFGRDMALGREASDLYVVGAGSEIYRLNIEQGQFLSSLQTDARQINCCEFNSEHELFVCGTSDGTVEAWDPRDGKRAGLLDCNLAQFSEDALVVDDDPAVTSVKFKDALHLGVGTSTGHILLYDIRSTRSRLIKNHNLGLPIKNLDFVPDAELVLSMDSQVLKMWREADGQPFAAIEPGTRLQQFVRFPNSGLLFFANDAPKMLQYFVPALGPAPKWCYYLDSLTEELEETEQPAVYDDYKFVTREQLEEIGLERLISTELLRAYMHGYFIDIRLYNKARTLTQPFAYESYKARKLREKVDEQRENRTLVKKAQLPKVNKELASKLQSDLSLTQGGKVVAKKQRLATALLDDNRFRDLFANPDFEMEDRGNRPRRRVVAAATSLEEPSIEEEQSATRDSPSSSRDSSPEPPTRPIKQKHKKQRETTVDGSDDQEMADEPSSPKQIEPKVKPPKPKQRFKLVGLESSRDFNFFAGSEYPSMAPQAGATMGERRKQLKKMETHETTEEAPFGGKSVTFYPKSTKKTGKKR